MPHFKDSQNSLYWLDDADVEQWAKPEWTQITDAEAEALRPKQELTVFDKLTQLDAENALTQRNLRETIMLMAEAFKTVTGGQMDLSQIPGVAKVYQVESDASALRAKL